VTRCTTSATFEAATVETAISLDAVVTAEGRAASPSALGISSAGATESDISTTSASAYWAADAVIAIESTTAMGAG
jgi:hypothetical protein